MDEIISYVSSYRQAGYHNRLYNFMQALSETARGQDNVVLVVSVPSSVISYTDADEADQQRFKHMLDRLGKAVIMAAETETSEIIRRRLFDWEGLPKEARRVAAEYADWIVDHRVMVPRWFPVDNAREAIEASYPFHPMALSVFERKWQALPRFQQTRGVLRMLALWVARAYQDGFKGAQKDPLIGLGTAPLEDPLFRTAVFEQLGENRLESAVTTDICGAKGSHAGRLDSEAVDAIKKARLHKKVATTVFFESNGGQAKEGEATVPEIRLAVAEPGIDVGNIETALDGLGETCYFLRVERNRYRFGLSPNLNKLLADRRANITDDRIDERIRAEILKVFKKEPGVEVVPFAEKSSQVPDRPIVSLVVMPPQHSMKESNTLTMVDAIIRQYGSSGRTSKSALLFALPDDDAPLREEARKLLAWEDIKDEENDRLAADQRKQLTESLKKAQRDLKEAVWRTYKNIALLGKNNKVRTVDLGLINSSQSESMVKLMVERLRQDGDIETGISPNFLVRNWPPAFTEWSTKSVRDSFFASPQFPRLLNGDAVKETIARGVSGGILAYVGKSGGSYNPFLFNTSIDVEEIELSDDMFIITADEAKKHIEPPKLTPLSVRPERPIVKPGAHITFQIQGLDQHGRVMDVDQVSWTVKGGEMDEKGGFKAGNAEGEYLIEAAADNVNAKTTVMIAKDDAPPPPPPPPDEPKKLRWTGDVPPQKWMNYYTKVLAKFATAGDLKLNVAFEITREEGFTDRIVDETKAALQELNLNDDVELSD
jgi:hypothetical protein